MNREKTIIEKINLIMPRSHKIINKVFESDSEILQFGAEKVLFSMDEFSKEDFFCEYDAFTLGWNCSIAAIADILASGGTPVFYAHSLTSPWPDDFISEFCKGAAEILKVYNTGFIGGDFGIAEEWRYTASVIGKVDEEKFLLRSTAKIGDIIYLTGKAGSGNLQAFMNLNNIKDNVKLNSLKFNLRFSESQIIKKIATACIDTSGGIFNAVNIIADFCGAGFILENIPLIDEGILLAKSYNLPEIILALGECGEYELLFTVSPDDSKNIDENKFLKIGRLTENTDKYIFSENIKYKMNDFNISARDYSDKYEYIKILLRYINPNALFSLNKND